MVIFSPSLDTKDLFCEIYTILSKSKSEVNEVWHEIKDFQFFSKLDEQAFDAIMEDLHFLKIEKWNHISINKISFILDAMEFLNKDIQNLSKLLDFRR